MRFSYFQPRFAHGPDSPHEGTSLGWLEPHGSRGFLSKGNRLYSEGGTGECPPGKREGGLPEPLTVLAANPSEKHTRLTLGGFLAPSPGGTLFLRQIARRASAPPDRETSPQGEYQTLVRYAQLCESHPSTGRSLGHRPVNLTVNRTKAQNKKKK